MQLALGEGRLTFPRIYVGKETLESSQCYKVGRIITTIIIIMTIIGNSNIG